MRVRLQGKPIKSLRRMFRAMKRRLGLAAPPTVLIHDGAPATPIQIRRARDLERLRRLLARRPDLQPRIVSRGRFDGVGSQAMCPISAMLFAEVNHCRYLHTPFKSVAHAQGDRKAWAARWEAFLGLGHGEAPAPDDGRFIYLATYVRSHRHNLPAARDLDLIILAEDYGAGEARHPVACRVLMARLRAKYRAGDKSTIRLHQTAGAVNVAVHVRRGDITADHYRFTTDAPILATIAQLRSVIAATGRRAHFNLFSEGTEEMFADYRQAGCDLHISADAFEAFHNLAMADVLVTAFSGFSFVAALMSDGAVIDRLDDPQSDRWIGRSDDGSFDEARLRAFLAKRFP